jgi:hypothetical protein
LQAVQELQQTTATEGTTSVSDSTELDRSAVASVDLSGIWELVVTEEFKAQYNRYLELMGLPYLVRSVAVNVIGMTKDEIRQSDDGRSLYIKAKNAKGIWERTLIASGPDQVVLEPIQAADGEEVLAEAWWANNGTVHHSWLKGGGKRYGFGSFESRRYLQDDGETLICESIFHPRDTRREKPTMLWKFHRSQQQAI